jgi:hypothetical protein
MSLSSPRPNIRVLPPVEAYERPMVDDPPDPPMDLAGRLGLFGILLAYGLIIFLLYRLWIWME